MFVLPDWVEKLREMSWWQRTIAITSGLFLVGFALIDFIIRLDDLLSVPDRVRNIWSVALRTTMGTAPLAWIILAVGIACLAVAFAPMWLPEIPHQELKKPTDKEGLIRLIRSVAERGLALGFTPPVTIVEPLHTDGAKVSVWLAGLEPFHKLAQEFVLQLSIYQDHADEVHKLRNKLNEIQESGTSERVIEKESARYERGLHEHEQARREASYKAQAAAHTIMQETARELYGQSGPAQKELTVPIVEAATRAYERTKNTLIGKAAEAHDVDEKELLSWYGYFLWQRMPLHGNQPPSRIPERIEIGEKAEYHLQWDDAGNLVLKESFDGRRFVNLHFLSADFDRIIAAINDDVPPAPSKPKRDFGQA